MKSQNKTPIDFSKEKPRHKKRKAKHSPKKADHKHQYYDVIVKVKYKGGSLYYFGNKCSICGHIGGSMKMVDEDGDWLNERLVLEKHSHLDIVETKW